MTKGRLISLLTFLLVLTACERDGLELTLNVGPYGEETRRVLLLYEAGYNSLSSSFAANISTLKEGYLPGKGRNDDVLLVFSHLTSSVQNYVKPTEPVLLRFYESSGMVMVDTLKTWPAGKPIADAAIVREVFEWVREAFPAAGYGAVFSSHSTGWLPAGYLADPTPYEGNDRTPGGNVWSAPRMQTFGQEYYEAGKKIKEIELKDFAAAIPYRLDYILFDACLMGTVEVAWALRDVCSQVAFSPCEIPAAGIDYRTLTECLLGQETPDLKGVCEDYYLRYKDDGTYGAAITMVDCSALDVLADACRPLFERYRMEIRTLEGKNVQVYDRRAGSKFYYIFFDLKDMLREAGATEEELAGLQRAMDEVIVYEAHTPKFLSVDLSRASGLATYLPARPEYKKDYWHGTEFLDGFYKENIAWNQATSFVE